MSKEKGFWDKASKHYDRTEERFEHIHNRSRENTKKHLKATDVVLDYGCGTGTNSCELAYLVEEIQAIDISPKMVEFAKQKASSWKVANVAFTQEGIFTQRLRPSSFDVVLAFNILHTIPDPQGATRRIYELLRPDGILISATPCLQEKKSFSVGMQILLVRVLARLGAIPIPIRRLKSLELDELIEGEGFQIMEAEKIYSGASSYFVAAKKAAKT